MELKPGYKMTEVGVIPEDWEVICIKNLAEIKTGNKNTQDSITGGKYPFFVRSQTVERINTYSFDGEAVLTAGDGVGTGKIFHYINGKFDYHQRVYKISNFSNKLNGYFFYLYFSSFFYNRIMQMTAKSSVDSVRMEMIADMPIALPPISEQQAIAAALSDVDELLSGLDRLIAKKKDIRLAAMQELLTGKKRLPGFRDNWVTFELGKCGNLQKQTITPSSCPHAVFYEYSMPAFDEDKKPVKVYSEKIYSNKLVIKGPVILFNKLNVRQRRVWLVNNTKNNSICSTEFLPYQTKKINLDLLKQILLTDETTSYFESCSTGTSNSQKRITPSIFLEYKCFLPPSLAEQQAIASVLSDMDAEIEALEARRDKVRNIKRGMMQELLTGKTRLISAGEPA